MRLVLIDWVYVWPLVGELTDSRTRGAAAASELQRGDWKVDDLFVAFDSGV